MKLKTLLLRHFYCPLERKKRFGQQRLLCLNKDLQGKKVVIVHSTGCPSKKVKSSELRTLKKIVNKKNKKIQRYRSAALKKSVKLKEYLHCKPSRIFFCLLLENEIFLLSFCPKLVGTLGSSLMSKFVAWICVL